MSEQQTAHDSESRARAFIEGSTPEQKAVREQLRRSRPVSEPQSPQREPMLTAIANTQDRRIHTARALAVWVTRAGNEAPPEVRRAANDALNEIDAMIMELHLVRAQLIDEMREYDDATAARADKLLADRRAATGDGAR